MAMARYCRRFWMYWSTNASGALAAHRASTACWFGPNGRSRKSGGLFGLGDHAAAEANRARRPKGSLAESAGVLTAASATPRGAARAHDVEAAEHVRMLHADAARAVAAHRVADEAATVAVRNGPVVRVDVGDNVVRDKGLEVARRHRARIHRPVVHRL